MKNEKIEQLNKKLKEVHKLCQNILNKDTIDNLSDTDIFIIQNVQQRITLNLINLRSIQKKVGF